MIDGFIDRVCVPDKLTISKKTRHHENYKFIFYIKGPQTGLVKSCGSVWLSTLVGQSDAIGSKLIGLEKKLDRTRTKVKGGDGQSNFHNNERPLWT